MIRQEYPQRSDSVRITEVPRVNTAVIRSDRTWQAGSTWTRRYANRRPGRGSDAVLQALNGSGDLVDAGPAVAQDKTASGGRLDVAGGQRLD